jgi:hypothetical protein
MTLVSRELTPRDHVGELRLRRYRAGELAAEEYEEVSRHTGECGACRARLKGFDDEQRSFEREIPFERFAGGVERAQRVPRARPRRVWTVGAAGLAAAAAVMLLFVHPDREHKPNKPNTVKGPDAALVIAAADGGRRSASTIEALRPGERARIGVRTEAPRHLVAVSIDDAGTVTPLYPERGGNLAVEPRRELTYLPDSLEFTGHGRERVFVLLSDRPLSVDEVEKAARAAHARARGDLSAINTVVVEGKKTEQFTWLLEKP